MNHFDLLLIIINLCWLIINISTARFLIIFIWLAFEGVSRIHRRIKIQLKRTLNFHKESLNVHSNHTHMWNYTWFKMKSHRHVEWLFYVLFVFLFYFFCFLCRQRFSVTNDTLWIQFQSNKTLRFFIYFYYTSLLAILYISLSGFYFNAYM